VTFTTVLSISALDFDAAAQANYTAALAAVAGVSASAITLTVSAGSVTVVATIRVFSSMAAEDAVSAVGSAASESVASGTIMGFPVATTPAQPTKALVVIAAPSSSEATYLIVVVAAPVAVLLLALAELMRRQVGAWCCSRGRRSRTKRKSNTVRACACGEASVMEPSTNPSTQFPVVLRCSDTPMRYV